ncbi:hypothetical protein ACFQGT_09445 [Natrialbaceae archaeon GCM10025810]|uniref:hypothetical protein n=1 Tax=Halovalidus salilacus TaxID=3075124 RepID=UPI00360D0372
MAIRNTETPPSRFERVVAYVRSTLSTGRRASADEHRENGARDGVRASTESLEDRGNLFQCGTCNNVYIAGEKNRCENCEDDVQEVRSHLSCQ